MKGIDVFNLAMGLMRKIDDAGAINEATTKKFKAQAPYILTLLQTELLGCESSDEIPIIINTLEEDLLIQDKTAIMIAPYGLASHLLIDQIPEKAGFFNDRYEELKRKIPATAEIPITDYYNSTFNG